MMALLAFLLPVFSLLVAYLLPDRDTLTRRRLPALAASVLAVSLTLQAAMVLDVGRSAAGLSDLVMATAMALHPRPPPGSAPRVTPQLLVSAVLEAAFFGGLILFTCLYAPPRRTDSPGTPRTGPPLRQWALLAGSILLLGLLAQVLDTIPAMWGYCGLIAAAWLGLAACFYATGLSLPAHQR
jgi:hypothetical protein